MSTAQKKAKRKRYPSDMSKNGWDKLKKLLRASKSVQAKGGRPGADLKEIINAILYVVKTGCSWRSMPHDLPNWSTAYGYFSRWSKDGTWQWVHAFLVRKARKQAGRENARQKSKSG